MFKDNISQSSISSTVHFPKSYIKLNKAEVQNVQLTPTNYNIIYSKQTTPEFFWKQLLCFKNMFWSVL